MRRAIPGHLRRAEGFTLSELMIVVAIIGILAAIAIPNFLSYQAKARQSEAKVALGGIFTSALAYFAEHDTFSVSPADSLHYSPSGSPRYDYYFGGTAAANRITASQGGAVSPCNVAPSASPTPAMSSSGFTAAAIGNIDSDPTCDEWEINDLRILTNSRNDVSS